MLVSLCVIVLVVATASSSEGGEKDLQHPRGHLQPMGSHRPSEGDIGQLISFPHPTEFYEKYVRGSIPVLFKDAAKAIPAYSLWTDQYLGSKYGHLEVNCEVGKKENRSQNQVALTMKKFVEVYDKQEIYMVQDVHPEMRVDLSMPRSLQCGGFQHNLDMVVMWFSSGGTKSVLHHDDIDNINCLFAGQKDMVMIDKKYKAEIEAVEWKTGGYSTVDVEKVDMYKFPALRDVPWYRAHMDTGDCLFIPTDWYHTVDSSQSRNLAVNLWFNHLMWFNESDCEHHSRDLTEYKPLDKYEVATQDGQWLSPSKIISYAFKPYQNLERLTVENMAEDWEFEIEDLQKLFEEMDKNKDGELTWKEVYEADVTELMRALQQKAEEKEQLEEGYEEVEELEEQQGPDVDDVKEEDTDHDEL